MVDLMQICKIKLLLRVPNISEMFPEKEMQFQEAGSDGMNMSSRYSPVVNFNLYKVLVIYPLLKVHLTLQHQYKLLVKLVGQFVCKSLLTFCTAVLSLFTEKL